MGEGGGEVALGTALAMVIISRWTVADTPWKVRGWHRLLPIGWLGQAADGDGARRGPAEAACPRPSEAAVAGQQLFLGMDFGTHGPDPTDYSGWSPAPIPLQSHCAISGGSSPCSRP